VGGAGAAAQAAACGEGCPAAAAETAAREDSLRGATAKTRVTLRTAMRGDGATTQCFENTVNVHASYFFLVRITYRDLEWWPLRDSMVAVS
jgi:hypothetical protein